jgi:A/G-specific adenine glycosylase
VVAEQHGGSFPERVDALAALPGVGRSTAAAIAVFAFGARAAILDGNVKRVLARHRAIDGYPGSASVAARLWAWAETLLPVSGVANYTQGMMDLGATVCVRSHPRCSDCPVRDDCVARTHGRIHELPTPRPRRTLPRRELRVLIVEHAGEILFERRPPAGVWAGLMSLPELPIDVDAARELQVRYGGDAKLGAALPPLTHGFTHFTLTLHPQRVALCRRQAAAESPSRVWLTREDARGAALPAPIRRLLRDL